MKTDNATILFFRKPSGSLLCSILLPALILAGCETAQHPPTQSPIPQEQSSSPPVEEITETEIAVISYGRYRLVEVDTTLDQQNLLAQLIDVTIPVIQPRQPTVFDALNYLLQGSGYTLCDDKSLGVFQRHPLPVAHRHLGPIALKDALSVLAGTAWQIQVDHYNRQICFSQVSLPAATIEHKQATGERP